MKPIIGLEQFRIEVDDALEAPLFSRKLYVDVPYRLRLEEYLAVPAALVHRLIRRGLDVPGASGLLQVLSLLLA